jgi:hypothetical protein
MRSEGCVLLGQEKVAATAGGDHIQADDEHRVEYLASN